VPPSLAQLIASAPRTSLDGQFERHTSANVRQLTGSDSGGRWSPVRKFSVLYLGRPRDSIVVEAYRHLVDPFSDMGMTGQMVAPRRIFTCHVNVTEILDLRSATGQRQVGLTSADLLSAIGEYSPCQRVGQVAHQLGLHGVIAPAATTLGETLALFERHLPATELPVIIREEIIDGLPVDPRRLHIVRPTSAHGDFTSLA
jgi:hypothetical protein